MDNMTTSTIEILKCFVGKDEEDMVFDLLNKSNYKVVVAGEGSKKLTVEMFNNILLDDNGRTFIMAGNIPYGTYPPLEAYLQEQSAPFKRWTDICEAFSPEIVVFDGVRLNAVPSNTEGDALVDMRALRSIIDMLEEDKEILALSYSNANWVETDVSNMWRYGMEAVSEFSTADNREKDTINVDVIKEGE